MCQRIENISRCNQKSNQLKSTIPLNCQPKVDGLIFVNKKGKNIETLSTKINKKEEFKKEIRNIEKYISKYINQRNIRKYLFKGLKEKINIQNEIDDKIIFLHRDIILDRDYHFYKYMFIIKEKNDNKQKHDSILKIEIIPDIFHLYFKVNVLSFNQNKITSQKIIDYLKLTIGIK